MEGSKLLEFLYSYDQERAEEDPPVLLEDQFGQPAELDQVIINKFVLTDVTKFQLTINDLTYQIVGGWIGLNLDWEINFLDHLISQLQGVTDFGFYGDDFLALNYLPETVSILRLNTLFWGDQAVAESVDVSSLKELYLNTLRLDQEEDYLLLKAYENLEKLTIVDRFYVGNCQLFLAMLAYCQERNLDLQINEIQGCEACYQYYVSNYLLTKAAR